MSLLMMFFFLLLLLLFCFHLLSHLLFIRRKLNTQQSVTNIQITIFLLREKHRTTFKYWLMHYVVHTTYYTQYHLLIQFCVVIIAQSFVLCSCSFDFKQMGYLKDINKDFVQLTVDVDKFWFFNYSFCHFHSSK